MSETRRAKDGNFYTLTDFVHWYGDVLGNRKWAQAEGAAGADEPGAEHAGRASSAEPAVEGAAGAEELGAEHAGRASSAEPAVRAGDGAGAAELGAPNDELIAGAEEPGAPAPPADRLVLLDVGAIHRLRVEAIAEWGDYGSLHTQARTELNRLIHAQGGVGAAEPGEVSRRFCWQHYLALHPRALELVGPGVVEFGTAAVKGTKDPNRGGLPRLDFVIHHVDGGYWRIHPGGKPKNDAIPRYFPPPDSPPVAPSDRWRYLPPGGFQYAHACTVPATDRLSKKTAWAELESLPDGYLDAGPDAKFKWWLWLGNLGLVTREVLGAGVVSAFLRRRGHYVKHVVCTRADVTEVTVELSLRGPGDMQTWDA